MARKWYFNSEELRNSPSFRDGVSAEKELDYKQQAAYLISDLGKRLKLSEVCVNTATVYMHRFYTKHSLPKFHRYEVAATAIFVTAKVREEPQKLEDVIRALHICLNRDNNNTLDTTTAEYSKNANNIVMNESLFLITFGFDMDINHPHSYILKFCRKIKASKELGNIFLQLATYTLQLTSMCVKYKPEVVACFCIYLTIKLSKWKIPEVIDRNPWFWLLDCQVTNDLLVKMDKEFSKVLNNIPSRIKNWVMCLFKSYPTGQLTSTNCQGRSSTTSDRETILPGAGDQNSSTRRKIKYQEYLDRIAKIKLSGSEDGSSTSSTDAAKVLQDDCVGSTCTQMTPATTVDLNNRIETINNFSHKRKNDTDTEGISFLAKKYKLS